MITVTERRQHILDYLGAYQRGKGVPPSSRDVARAFGISQPAATKNLQALAREGRVTKMADRKWGLGPAALAAYQAVPVFGAIPAGRPTMEEQEAGEVLNVDPAIFGVRPERPGDFWLLRVKGDSMVGAAIQDGDLVALIRREPRIGEIVAALVDETTTTLKRLVREGGRAVLRAENPRYPDLAPVRMEAQGVVVGVIRQAVTTLP